MKYLPHAILIVSLLLLSMRPKGRDFAKGILPLILFGFLYDLLRFFPKSWAGPIRVTGPYELERHLFGFTSAGQELIPCDWFLQHTHPALDLVAALAYSLHMIVPLAFFLYGWWRYRETARRFARCFLLANLLAFATYILLPVAPPWYVENYGLFAAPWDLVGDAAGLKGFDQLIGTPYFEKIYAQSAWVYGAIPSMHAGFPILVILFARKVLRRALLPLTLFAATVWFSAVYLRHHYIIDLLAGALYVLFSYWLYQRWNKS